MRVSARIPVSCTIALVIILFGLRQQTVAIPTIPQEVSTGGHYVSQNLVLFYTSTGLHKANNDGWKLTSWPEGNYSISLGGAIYTYNHTTRAIHRSQDGGDTWSATGTFTITDTAAFSFLSASPVTETLFMGMGYTFPNTGPVKGIYKSTDSGITWDKVLDGYNAGEVLFSPNFAQDGTAFTTFGGYKVTYGVWKTADWGQTWFHSSEGLPTGGSLSGYRLAISPQFAQDHTVFAFSEYGFVKSIDGGASWQLLENLPGYLPINIAVSPNYLYDQTLLVGDQDEGLFLSRDGGVSWHRLDSFPTAPYFTGIRQVASYVPWPPIPPAEPPGPYRIYLPFVSQQRTSQLELWAVGYYPWPDPSRLYRSYDFGAIWEEVFVFERSHWLYLPLVAQSSVRE